MNLDNILNDNGFVTIHDMMARLNRFRPSPRVKYMLRKSNLSDFAEIGLVNGDISKVYLKVYAGNEVLYNHVKELFERAAASLSYPFVSSAWKQRT